MAAGIGYWLVTIPVRIVLGVFLVVIVLVVVVFIIFVCATNFNAWWRSPGTRRLRLGRLGGVTTLSRRLAYPCAICRDSMEAGEKVRTLSCGHVFHCGGIFKCELGIDAWLLAENEMSLQSCPVCRQVPRPVQPQRRAPSSSAQTSDLEEEEFLFPSHWFDETPSE